MEKQNPVEKRINLGDLRDNINTVRESLPSEKKLAFVVKSDAYGHGIERVSKFVESEGLADYLAVATLAEGRTLRGAGVKLPILMLTPPMKEQLDELVSLDISVTIGNIELARQANKIAEKQGKDLGVHVSIDTGMGRFGILPDGVVDFFSELAGLDKVRVEGVFSHCSVADSPKDEDRDYTKKQIETFRKCLEELKSENLLPPYRHIANSATFESLKNSALEPPLNMVRLGALIYGCHEISPSWGEEVTPVMEFGARIVDIRDLPPGSYISYERSFKTNRETRVGVLPVGYCEGLDRRLSNKVEFRLGDRRVPVIGKICSNHTMIDLTDAGTAEIGDRVIVFGKDPDVREFAESIGSTLLEIWYPDSKNIARVYEGGG